MQRRTFFRAGAAAGLLTLVPPLPRRLWAEPRRIPRAGPLRLNSNENPLGLAPAARQAVLDGIAEANRYPFTAIRAMREAIARRHGTTPDHILIGNGSTEILRVAVAAYAGPAGVLIAPEPTFEDITDYARPFAYRIERVPLTPAFAHDLAAMADRARRTPDPAVVYICNPNNPTATLTSCADLTRWIAEAPERVFFVIDEAYFDFVDDAGYRSFDKDAMARSNVMVTRTFSKIFGMAGLRAGYAIAHPATIERLALHVTQSTPNHLAQVAAIASLQDEELVPRGRTSNARARRILFDALEALDLEYLPSQANFVMHRIPGEHRDYQRRMQEGGVLVGRPFPPMLGYNRVSIGLPEEMERFVELLREFRRQGWV
jgi:histidinol-phosphate aminotransferase